LKLSADGTSLEIFPALQLLLKAFAFKELSSGYKTSSFLLGVQYQDSEINQPFTFHSLSISGFRVTQTSDLPYIYYSVDLILTGK